MPVSPHPNFWPKVTAMLAITNRIIVHFAVSFSLVWL